MAVVPGRYGTARVQLHRVWCGIISNVKKEASCFCLVFVFVCQGPGDLATTS